MKSLHALLLLAALSLLAGLAQAQGRDKVALVIGNNKYASSPLRNAANDAKDLSESLKQLGFRVILREDATRQGMYEALREFGNALDGASTALFFYAGHGMQFKDRNYLIPIDVAMGSEEDVTFFAVDVQQVFDRMERAKTKFNFIILDACRDNPFASSFKVSSAGLAQMSAPSGTLIAYATAPGSTAQDGFQRNGMYTKHLLNNITVPDVPVEIMFKRVREAVERETLKKQTPWDSSSLKGDFFFNASTDVAGKPARAAAAPGAVDKEFATELEIWQSARASNRLEDYQAYLSLYPNGRFALLAKNSIEALTRVAKGPSPQPATPPASTTVATAPSPAASLPQARAAAEPAPEKSPPVAAPATPPKATEPSPERKPEAVVLAVPAASAPAPAAAPASASAPVTTPPAAPPPKKDEIGREIAPNVREVTFADGAIYRGGVRGSALHGKGEYVGKAFRYDGEWRDGIKHGSGIFTWENGNRYEGPFVDDQPEGRGKFIFANGDVYAGEVKQGRITGRGIYTKKEGDTLEGSFVDGNLNGKGIHRFASGERYEGDLANGKPQGKGNYFTKDGDRIEGDFADGQPNGKGTYHFANGDRYEGDIVRSELTGNGAYFWKSGAKYEGEIRQARPQGKGTYWFPDGTRFDGQFEDGLARATGELTRPDGRKVRAEIVQGQAREIP